MTWHRHLGVYGICYQEGRLLVVHKTNGPYRNRYDLPGGTVEPQETLPEALEREFMEEAGLEVDVLRQAGIGEYVVPYPIREHSHIQHLAILFEAACSVPTSFRTDRRSDDAKGAEWVSLADISADTASPLVMSAKLYLAGDPDAFASRKLDSWIVKA